MTVTYINISVDISIQICWKYYLYLSASPAVASRLSINFQDNSVKVQ